LTSMEDAETANLIEEYEELATLTELAEQGDNYAPDWSYGETLIHEDHFTKYSKQLCEDTEVLDRDTPTFIWANIDWDGVAEDLKMDYTAIDWDGATYYIR